MALAVDSSASQPVDFVGGKTYSVAVTSPAAAANASGAVVYWADGADPTSNANDGSCAHAGGASWKCTVTVSTASTVDLRFFGVLSGHADSAVLNDASGDFSGAAGGRVSLSLFMICGILRC